MNMTHLATTEITSDPTLQSRQDGPYIVLSVVEQGKSIPVIGMLPRAYRKWLRMELARWSCETQEAAIELAKQIEANEHAN